MSCHTEFDSIQHIGRKGTYSIFRRVGGVPRHRIWIRFKCINSSLGSTHVSQYLQQLAFDIIYYILCYIVYRFQQIGLNGYIT
jgi:hypothetical protein